MAEIQLQIPPHWQAQVDSEGLLDAVEQALAAEGEPGNVGLSLVLVSDDEMRRMHQQYRADPDTTDILTFPYEAYEHQGAHSEVDEVVQGEMGDYLGDIVICYEQAARQAAEEGHSAQEELLLLAVHGVLHLLGYDDESPASKSEMWQRQRAIMQRLGLEQIAPRD